ncbi:group II intron reverse transcriptase/maturase [Nostocales cyanobacterium LEGE 12452]|nr:group II intron reverse transcriptase/maturase [Nostocales cyanobacterium LEGE 12452]
MNTSYAPKLLVNEWKDIPWRTVERKVFKLQKRIYGASKRGDVRMTHKLQRLLMSSWSAKALAVRRVTQDNQGRKTAGVDGVSSLKPHQRLALINKLEINGKSKPTRRVWIPKPGKAERRPLGIPTMYDRALQALVKLALEPEWEAKFEANSYGFRPGRSSHDAISAIFNYIRYKPKWVLDADIAGCFDNINHSKLLEKLNSPGKIQYQIKAWLKSGVIDKGALFPTKSGTPQGGVISPLLANIALHGLEEVIQKTFPRISTTEKGKRIRRNNAVLIRYADDFVILHEDKEIVMRCKEIAVSWLQEIGLELKDTKTRMAHTLEEVEKPGFDFLGFYIRQYPQSKHNSAKDTQGNRLGFKTLIKPSDESLQNHYRKLSQIISKNNSRNQTDLIKTLNPIIRGWTQYYSSVASKETYDKLDYLLYLRLRRWAVRRHGNKGKRWIQRKYWKTVGNRSWAFANRDGAGAFVLRNHGETPILRHAKVRDTASPFDGNTSYWASRLGKHPEIKPSLAYLLKRQKGKCNICGLFFQSSDVIEVDHITPKSKGGKDNRENKQAVHRHCHDDKTAKDGSRSTCDKGCSNEEPDDVKASRPVLKPSRRGDSSA